MKNSSMVVNMRSAVPILHERRDTNTVRTSIQAVEHPSKYCKDLHWKKMKLKDKIKRYDGCYWYTNITKPHVSYLLHYCTSLVRPTVITFINHQRERRDLHSLQSRLQLRVAQAFSYHSRLRCCTLHSLCNVTIWKHCFQQPREGKLLFSHTKERMKESMKLQTEMNLLY